MVVDSCRCKVNYEIETELLTSNDVTCFFTYCIFCSYLWVLGSYPSSFNIFLDFQYLVVSFAFVSIARHLLLDN